MGFIPILTRRLILRLPMKEDIPQISRLMNDPDIARFYGGVQYPCTPLSVWKWFYRTRVTDGKTTALHYVAVLRSNPNIIVGSAHIALYSKHSWPAVGYWLGKNFRKKRFASEIARALIGTIFRETDINAVRARCAIANVPMQRVLKAVGFRRSGYMWLIFPEPRRYVRAHNYLLHRQQWLARARNHESLAQK